MSLKSVLNAVLLSSSLLLPQSFAQGILSKVAGDKSINGVNIAKSATLSIDGRKNDLVTIAAGLRTKTLVVNLNVYVMQVYVATKEQMATVQESVDKASTVVFSLDFLRTVEASKVQTSFRDGLVANGVNLNDAAIAQFLKAVSESGDAEDEGTMILAFEKLNDGSEIISYESTDKTLKSFKAPAGTANNIMKIWFGKPADSGLETLKKTLLAGLAN